MCSIYALSLTGAAFTRRCAKITCRADVMLSAFVYFGTFDSKHHPTSRIPVRGPYSNDRHHRHHGSGQALPVPRLLVPCNTRKVLKS
jgi:hypothetical protein